jgi:hypothetical protein
VRIVRVLPDAPFPAGVDEDEALSAIRDELFLRGFRDVKLSGDTIAFGPRRLFASLGIAGMASGLLRGGTARLAPIGGRPAWRLDLRVSPLVQLTALGLMALVVVLGDDAAIRAVLLAHLAVVWFFAGALGAGVMEGIVRSGLHRAGEAVRLRAARSATLLP